jgi:hypothetical protein
MLSAEKLGNQIAVGGNLTSAQIKALSKVSVDANSVLDNLEALNEEISESGYEVTRDEPRAPQVKVAKVTNEPVVKSSATFKSKLNKGNQPQPQVNKVQVKPQPKEAEMDFDQELQAAEEELNKAEATAAPETMREQIIELLKNTKGAPSANQIAKWKMEYGEKGVHVMAFGEGDVYIFTHLKRGQWKKIQELMQKAQATGQVDVEDMLKEKTISYCTLWPNPLPLEFFYNSKAGVVDSLYQVILLNSYFLSPQQAMMLTTQL